MTSIESGHDDSIQEVNAVDEPPDSADAQGAMSDSAKTIRQDTTLLEKYNKHRREQEALNAQIHGVHSDALGKHLSSTAAMPSSTRIRHGTHSRSTSTSSMSHSPSPTTTESSIHSPITPYGTSPMPPFIAIDNASFSKRPVSPQSSGPSSLLSELLRSPPRSPNADAQDITLFADVATRTVSLEGQLEQLESSPIPTAKQPIVTRKPTKITFAVEGTSSPRLIRKTSSQASTSPPSATTLTPANLLDAAADPPYDNRPMHVKFVAEDTAPATGKERDEIKSPLQKSIQLKQVSSQTSSRETSPAPKSILSKKEHMSPMHSRDTSPPPRSILIKEHPTSIPSRTPSREASPPAKSILIKEQTRPAPSRTPSREPSPPPKSILIKEQIKSPPSQTSSQNPFQKSSQTPSQSPSQTPSRDTTPLPKAILIMEQMNATPSLMSRTLSTSPVEIEVPVRSILLKSPQPPSARITEEDFTPKPRKLSTLTFAVENAPKTHFRGRSPPPTMKSPLESMLAKEVAEQDEQDEMDDEQQAEDGTDENNDEDDTDDRDEDDDENDENDETARGEEEEFDEGEADDNEADEDDLDTTPKKDSNLEDLTIEDVANVEDDVNDDADDDDDDDDNGDDDELEVLDDEQDHSSSVDESDFVPGSLDEDLALLEAAKMLKPLRPQDIDPTFPTDDDEDDQAVDNDSDPEIQAQARRTSRASSGRSSANPSRRGSRSTSKDAQAAKFQHTPPVFSKPAPIVARAFGTASQKAPKRGNGGLVRSKSLPQRRKRIPAAVINGHAVETAALKSVRPSLLVRTSTDGRRVASEGVRSRPVAISTVEQESAQKIKAVMSGEVTAPSGISNGHQKKAADSLFVLSI